VNARAPLEPEKDVLKVATYPEGVNVELPGIRYYSLGITESFREVDKRARGTLA
jgi:hypothetical protein